MPHQRRSQRPLAVIWAEFVPLLAAQSPHLLVDIRQPATREALQHAEQRLQCALPDELRQLYLLADGFAAGAYLLQDDYRLLPLDELVAASLALVGEPVVLDELAGEFSLARSVSRVVFAQARADDPDVAQVSLRLWPKRLPRVEVWYRAGGIHDFEELADSGEGLADWLEACLEYYR